MFDPKLLTTLSSKPLYKKTLPKKKIVTVPIKPKYTGPTVISESRRLKEIQNKINTTTNENTRASLVQNYYDLSTKIDRMIEDTNFNERTTNAELKTKPKTK